MLNPELSIRLHRPDDARATRDVFRRAVRGTAARFYDPVQIDAWAQGGDVDLTTWNERRERLGFIVDQENPQNQVRGVRVPNCDMHIDLMGEVPG